MHIKCVGRAHKVCKGVHISTDRLSVFGRSTLKRKGEIESVAER